VDGIEAGVEGLRRVNIVAGAKQAGPVLDLRVADGTPAVIHVDLNVFRDGDVLLSGHHNGLVHGVNHPDLGNCNHETKANWTAVIGRVVAPIIYEIGRREETQESLKI
jgi:hypothetical protein